METTQQSQEEVPKTKRRTKYRHKKLTVCARRLSRRHSCVLKRKLKKAAALMLSSNQDNGENQQTNKTKCIEIKADADTSASSQMLSTMSALGNFPIYKIYEENEGKLEELEIIEESVEIIELSAEEQRKLSSNNEIIEEIVEIIDLSAEEQRKLSSNNGTVQIYARMSEDSEEDMFDETPKTLNLNKYKLLSQETISSSQETMFLSQDTMNQKTIPSDTESECELVAEKVNSQEPEQPILGKVDFVDFQYIFDQIVSFSKHSNIGCGIEHLKIVELHNHGLRKEYDILCQMCNRRLRMSCIKENDNFMDLNDSAVSATMLSGGGYSQLEQVLCSMNVSCMSGTTYNKTHEKIIEAFELAALREMEEAGKQEKQLAIERGDLCEGSNIPWIPVVADGSWMKRSYKGRYPNSLSGVGVIIGYHTKKVLYVGVKNKLCRICDIGKRRNKQPHPHRCFKNWGSSQSSTAMESFAIMEGFQSSVEQHGLVYSILIADGDSSVYKKILDCDPYKEYSVRVRKIECSNHMLRNFSKKINQVVAGGGYRQLKTVVKASIFRLRAGIRKAAEYRFKEKLPLSEQIEKLKVDLKNVPSHIFGEHKDCERLAYFCNKHSDPNVINYVPQLKEAGIYKRVEEAMQPLFNKIESLLYGINSNIVESFNSVIAKYIGAKRINYGSRGSYQGRVSAAVVQFNSKEVLSRLCRAMDKEPTTIIRKLEEQRKRNLLRGRKYISSLKGRAHREHETQLDDKDYGPCAEQPEIEEIVFTPEYERQMTTLRKC